MKLFDISPLISDQIAVFPGDVPFSRDLSLQFPQDHLSLSSIRTTLHLGAHADASNHYHPSGEGIEKRPLANYLGQAQVIEVSTKKGERIYPKDLLSQVQAPRVLLKTLSFPCANTWNDDFSSCSPELLDFLATKNVCLVGIDTPSVDPAKSKDLESHQALYRHKMAVLEGLILEAVPSGLYTLIALPLAIANADASPVRAILLPDGSLTLP